MLNIINKTIIFFIIQKIPSSLDYSHIVREKSLKCKFFLVHISQNKFLYTFLFNTNKNLKKFKYLCVELMLI
ncbi:hypothetical protein CEQ83_05660 [Priestia megaterium]|nr:hypothetical protein CEQ83_05660 [Priestia megaterium]